MEIIVLLLDNGRTQDSISLGFVYNFANYLPYFPK